MDNGAGDNAEDQVMPADGVGIHLRAFNWHLWEARKAKGYTQYQLADLAGMSRAKPGLFECLQQWPREDEALELASILDIDETVLFPEALRKRCANVPASVRFRVPLTALPAPDEPNMIEAPFNAELRAALASSIDTLTAKERAVIRLRYGLGDGRQKTYDQLALNSTEIGFAGPVTRERVRQVEQKALRKLRHPSRAKRLRGFIAPIEEVDDAETEARCVARWARKRLLEREAWARRHGRCDCMKCRYDNYEKAVEAAANCGCVKCVAARKATADHGN